MTWVLPRLVRTGVVRGHTATRPHGHTATRRSSRMSALSPVIGSLRRRDDEKKVEAEGGRPGPHLDNHLDHRRLQSMNAPVDDALLGAHNTAIEIARTLSGYTRSSLLRDVSAHFFGNTATMSEARRFFERTRTLVRDELGGCVGSSAASVVLSLKLQPNRAATKRRRADDDGEAQPGAGVARSRLASFIPSFIPSFLPGRDGRRQGLPSYPPKPPDLGVTDRAWEDANACVAALGRLSALDGERVVQHQAITINSDRPSAETDATRRPKLIVVARLAAGLPVPFRRIVVALPTRKTLDGIFSTDAHTLTSRALAEARPTAEEVTVNVHGHRSLCIVVGIPY